MLLSILLACSSEEAPTEPSSEPSNEPSTETGDPVPVEEVEYIWMSDIQKLNRISMALRGTRPDSQDVLDVLEDPTTRVDCRSIPRQPRVWRYHSRYVCRDIADAISVVLPPLGDLLTHIHKKEKLLFRGIIEQ